MSIQSNLVFTPRLIRSKSTKKLFLTIDNHTYQWSINRDQPKVLRRINLEKGDHKYKLLVKSIVMTDKGRQMVIGSSSGNLKIEKSKDLKLK